MDVAAVPQAKLRHAIRLLNHPGRADLHTTAAMVT